MIRTLLHLLKSLTSVKELHLQGDRYIEEPHRLAISLMRPDLTFPNIQTLHVGTDIEHEGLSYIFPNVQNLFVQASRTSCVPGYFKVWAKTTTLQHVEIDTAEDMDSIGRVEDHLPGQSTHSTESVD